jgi:hypothetical protein
VRHGYSKARKWGDRFIPHGIEIIGVELQCDPGDIRESSPEDDMKRAIDLYTPKGSVSFRIRGHEYLSRYPGDITIRKNPDEWFKYRQLDGPDFMFYGFGIEPENLIEAYTLWKIEYLIGYVDAGYWKPGRPKGNFGYGDDTSFIVVPAEVLIPAGAIIARRGFHGEGGYIGRELYSREREIVSRGKNARQAIEIVR